MPSVPARAEIGLSLCAWAIGGASFARGLEGLGGATYYSKYSKGKNSSILLKFPTLGCGFFIFS